MIKRRIPINALSRDIFTILSDNLTVPVYENVPIDTDCPYVTISDYEYEMESLKTVDAIKVTFELEIWTDYSGKAEVNSIAEQIVSILTACKFDLSDDGFKVIGQDVKGGRGLRSGDYFYGIVNFAATVQNIGLK